MEKTVIEGIVTRSMGRGQPKQLWMLDIRDTLGMNMHGEFASEESRVQYMYEKMAMKTKPNQTMPN